MRYSSLKRGKRAITEASFVTLNGDVAKCGLRVLLGEDHAAAIQSARDYSKARGLDKPADGEPLYELGKAVHLVLLAAVDLDDPTGETPFFDGGEAQVLAGLDVERIFLLKEKQLAWQDECLGTPSKISADAYIAAVFECASAAEGASLPFESWQPVLRRSFVRSLATQLVSSLTGKSPSGSAFDGKPPTPSA